MNSRDRILAALEHKEPDNVPYDLAGTHVSGIHINAYCKLCEYLGITPEPIVFTDIIQQIVLPKQEILDKFQVDTRGLFPLCSHNWNVVARDAGDHFEYKDEWGIVHQCPKNNAFWWSIIKSPLDSTTISATEIHNHPWPVPDDILRIKGLRQLAEQYRRDGKLVMIKSICAGMFEMSQRLRGMENALCDFLLSPDVVANLFDNLLDIKLRFWEMALNELGDIVDVVVETDDYGTQESQLISHETFKQIIKPRVSKLVAFVKRKLNSAKNNGEKGYFFLHSCGNVRPLIPDFIDMGIDIINPVHIRATGMDPVALKRDFGKDIVFWGGGVDTQSILPYGTPAEVADNVKQNTHALMADGGFVFTTIHNIQAEVPPQNIVAMLEAVQKYGKYSA